MKRFYTDVHADAVETGWQILLDGRPVRTPDRAPLVLPTMALAHAICAEWTGQGEEIEPRSMPMTGLANATIDRVFPDRDGFVGRISAYAESDLLCYRAEAPNPLIVRQSTLWDPVLEWAAGRYGIRMFVTTGILPIEQDSAMLDRLQQAVATLNPWLLAPLSTIVSITGSLVASLAAIEHEIDADRLWSIGMVDEDWQAEQWGTDADAAALAAARREEFDLCWRFISQVRA